MRAEGWGGQRYSQTPREDQAKGCYCSEGCHWSRGLLEGWWPVSWCFLGVGEPHLCVHIMLHSVI